MIFYKKIFLIVSFLFLAGCATIKPIEYPAFDSGVSVHVSKKTISTFTETPAGDSLIPNSQVFVAKQGRGASAFGGLIGVAIDRSGAKKRSSDTKEKMAIYFDDDVKSSLSKSSYYKTLDLIFVDADSSADFTLLPSIRFALNKQKSSSLEFRLTTRYHGEGKPKTKNYFYYISNTERPLSGDDGWFGNAEEFQSVKEKGLHLLVETFLNDIAGGLPTSVTDSRKIVQWKSKWSKKAADAVFLKDFGEQVVLATIFKGEPNFTNYFIVDKADIK